MIKKLKIIFALFFFIFPNLSQAELVNTVRFSSGHEIDFFEKLPNDHYLIMTNRRTNLEAILLDKEFNQVWKREIDVPAMRFQNLKMNILFDDEHVFFLHWIEGSLSSNISSINITRIAMNGRVTNRDMDLALNGTHNGAFIYDRKIYLLQSTRREYRLNVIQTENLRATSQAITLPELESGRWNIQGNSGDVMFFHAAAMDTERRS